MADPSAETYLDQGVRPSTVNTTTAASTTTPGSSGGYGYGNGGSSGSSEPTDEQKKAADNLGAIAGYNAKTLKKKAKQGDKAFDIADKQNKLMRLTQTKQNQRNAGNDWYTRQQKLQSVTSWLADASGNAMNGSFYNDLNDLIARQDDMDDVEVLNQMRENQNQIDNDYYDALMANNNSRNELYIDTESGLRELAADYASQLNNIHPELAEDAINTKKKTLNIPSSKSTKSTKNLSSLKASGGKSSKNSKDTGSSKSSGSSDLSWLNTSYFDNHVRDAIKPTTQGLYRPENAANTAASKRLDNKDTTSQYSGAGNQDYWSRARSGYQRRTQ